jgi:hypothetical protein
VAVPGFGPLGLFPGPIYTSTDAGFTWVQADVACQLWRSIGCSADGQRIVGAAWTGQIFQSNDAGATWARLVSPSAVWNSVALSADGSRLVGATDSTGIFASTSTPPVRLRVARVLDKLTLSWTIPSIRFVLQRTSNLNSSAWSDVPAETPPNFTNLDEQVTIPVAVGPTFFRLISR